MVQKQVFAVATYDALFKYVLSNDEIRPSFFHAFIPDINIKSSKRIDDHMNPLNELEILRKLVHSKETKKTIADLGKESTIEVLVSKNGMKKLSKELTEFVTGVFDDLKRAFPKEMYDGNMDFVCQLDLMNL